MVFCLAHYLALNQTRIGDFKRGYLYPLGIIGAFTGSSSLSPILERRRSPSLVGLILLFLAGAKWRYILPTIGLSATAFASSWRTIRTGCAASRRSWTSRATSRAAPTSSTSRWRPSPPAGLRRRGAGPGAPADQLPARGAHRLHLRRRGRGARHVVHPRRGRRVRRHLHRGARHLRRAPNLFHFLLAAGCLLLMCLQSIINLGVVTGFCRPRGCRCPSSARASPTCC
jgi:cell division protein FtsW